MKIKLKEEYSYKNRVLEDLIKFMAPQTEYTKERSAMTLLLFISAEVVFFSILNRMVFLLKQENFGELGIAFIFFSALLVSTLIIYLEFIFPYGKVQCPACLTFQEIEKNPRFKDERNFCSTCGKYLGYMFEVVK